MNRLAAAALVAAGLHLLFLSLELDRGGLQKISRPKPDRVTVFLATSPPSAITAGGSPAASNEPLVKAPAPPPASPAARKPLPARRPAAEAAKRPAPEVPPLALEEAKGDQGRRASEYGSAEYGSPDLGAKGEASTLSGSSALSPPAPALEAATPDYDRNPPPAYPLRARQLGFEGTVILDVAVNAEGAVDAVALAVSSGYAMLDEAALSAVKKWRFTPARRGGLPVPARVRVPVRFALAPPVAGGN